jgi:hypothetical protein
METSAISNISFFILMIIKFVLFFKYTYNPTTAIWRPRDMQLENLSTQFGTLKIITDPQSSFTSSSYNPIEQAKSMAMNIPKYVYDNVDFRANPLSNIPDEHQEFIWFVTPKQIIEKILNIYEQNDKYQRN